MQQLIKDLKIDILCSRTVYLEQVPGLRNRAPYWRFHWSESEESSVTSEKNTYYLGKNKAMLIPPGQWISRCLKIPSSHYFMHFTLEAHNLECTGGPYDIILSEMEQNECFFIQKHCTSNTLSFYESISLNSFLIKFLARIPACDWLEKNIDKRIMRAAEKLKNNLSEKQNNKDLARRAGMSTNAFIRLFKNQMGEPPLTYHLRKRIESAEVQLEHTDKSIEEIADNCGFCDRNYFTRMFSSQNGISPAEYRKRMKSR